MKKENHIEVSDGKTVIVAYKEFEKELDWKENLVEALHKLYVKIIKYWRWGLWKNYMIVWLGFSVNQKMVSQ